MKTNKLTIFFRTTLIISFILCLILGIFWYPFSISLSTVGFSKEELTTAQNIEFWSQLIFYWLTIIPIFLIIYYSWILSCSFKKEDIFTDKNANIIKKILLINTLDLLIYFIGNIVFLTMKWNDFFLLYLLIFIFGIITSGLLFTILLIIKKGFELHIHEWLCIVLLNIKNKR